MNDNSWERAGVTERQRSGASLARGTSKMKSEPSQPNSKLGERTKENGPGSGGNDVDHTSSRGSGASLSRNFNGVNGMRPDRYLS